MLLYGLLTLHSWASRPPLVVSPTAISLPAVILKTGRGLVSLVGSNPTPTVFLVLGGVDTL